MGSCVGALRRAEKAESLPERLGKDQEMHMILFSYSWGETRTQKVRRLIQCHLMAPTNETVNIIVFHNTQSRIPSTS